MLYLSRKTGESIVINNAIEVTVVEIKGKVVKLGFTFPSTASVLRKEIHDKIIQENMTAAGKENSADGAAEDFDCIVPS